MPTLLWRVAPVQPGANNVTARRQLPVPTGRTAFGATLLSTRARFEPACTRHGRCCGMVLVVQGVTPEHRRRVTQGNHHRRLRGALRPGHRHDDGQPIPQQHLCLSMHNAKRLTSMRACMWPAPCAAGGRRSVACPTGAEVSPFRGLSVPARIVLP